MSMKKWPGLQYSRELLVVNSSDLILLDCINAYEKHQLVISKQWKPLIC
jgi:hypothetical protein